MAIQIRLTGRQTAGRTVQSHGQLHLAAAAAAVVAAMANAMIIRIYRPAGSFGRKPPAGMSHHRQRLSLLQMRLLISSSVGRKIILNSRQRQHLHGGGGGDGGGDNNGATATCSHQAGAAKAGSGFFIYPAAISTHNGHLGAHKRSNGSAMAASTGARSGQKGRFCASKLNRLPKQFASKPSRPPSMAHSRIARHLNISGRAHFDT